MPRGNGFQPNPVHSPNAERVLPDYIAEAERFSVNLGSDYQNLSVVDLSPNELKQSAGASVYKANMLGFVAVGQAAAAYEQGDYDIGKQYLDVAFKLVGGLGGISLYKPVTPSTDNVRH